MKNSLKYKLIMLFFLLVFISMTIVGLFISNEFESYNMNNVRKDMINISKNLVNNISVLSKDDFKKYRDDLQKSINETPISKSYELSIIDPETYEILASTNSTYDGKNAFDVLNPSVLIATVSENVVEKDITADMAHNRYAIKNMAFVNRDENMKIRYILYERRSLEDIDNMINSVTLMLLKATLLSLVVIIILGYFISSSITNPINSLTRTALLVSKGDFSKKVDVKSNDEIGQLGYTFNYLTKSLEDMIKALSSEKSKLNAIIYHMQNGLVAIDNFGKIIHYNANFEEMIFGNHNGNDLAGKNYDDVIKLCTDELSFSNIIRNYSQNISKDIDFSLGDRFYKSSMAVFKEENGALAGIIIVFQDITESQRLENLRREFVANVSHELKTPITSIKSYSETLLDGAIDDRQTAIEFLHVIENESDRMNNIIKDLLQLSHIDYKKVNWDMTKTDINYIIRDCIAKMKVHAQKKNQTIVDDTKKEKIIAMVDKSKFEQVIINLISNAIKYSNEGGVIHLSTSIVDKTLKVVVRDNGMGIPKKDLPFIFDRFYRVDKGRSRALGGTGLGLSICNGIIQEHGGKITVKSMENVGSEFTVQLPVD